MDCYSDNDGRYERLNFNYTEDDYNVADILINLASLVRLYEPKPPICIISKDANWGAKRRRSAWKVSRKLSLRANHSPPRANNFPVSIEVNHHNRKPEVNSPSSPLDYPPNQQVHTNNDNNINIQSNQPLKNKSKKKKPIDWEDHIKELQQTKEQLMRSLETVKTYYRTVLGWNKVLRSKRDEKNRVLIKQSPQKVTREFDLNKNLEEPQQKFYSFALQPGFFYPNPFLPATNFDHKVAMAAEARKRRMFKINNKKNSFGEKKLN